MLSTLGKINKADTCGFEMLFLLIDLIYERFCTLTNLVQPLGPIKNDSSIKLIPCWSACAFSVVRLESKLYIRSDLCCWLIRITRSQSDRWFLSDTALGAFSLNRYACICSREILLTLLSCVGECYPKFTLSSDSRVYVSLVQNSCVITYQGSCGLVFFGTPHAGPTEDAKVKFGRVCASIAQSIPTNASNDIMEALKKGSLFSDMLQENWRHQLERYHIVSFYEGIGNVRNLSKNSERT